MTAISTLHHETGSEGVARGKASGTQLLALTQDPMLAHAAQELAGEAVTVQVFEELRLLADGLMQHGNAVVLVDAEVLRMAADAAVDSLKSQFPDITLMVAGHAAEHTLLGSRIAQQKVFRFVHKPASSQRLKLYLEAAHQPASTRPASTATAATGLQRTLPPRSGGVSPSMIAGAIALAALLAAAAWWWLRGEEVVAERGQGTSVPQAMQVLSPDVAALLARADAAFAAGNFVAADGSSAAELYREAIRMDARNGSAADGLERAVEGALGNAEQALLAGSIDLARQQADSARAIVPASARLAFLQAQIERESTRVSADATQRQAFEARQAQIRNAVALVTARIASGALLEPPGDSAVRRYRDAQRLGGGDPLVRGSRDALVAALLTAADREAAAARAPAALRFVDAAASLNASAPGLDIVRRRVEEVAAPATPAAASSGSVGSAAAMNGTSAADAGAAGTTAIAPARAEAADRNTSMPGPATGSKPASTSTSNAAPAESPPRDVISAAALRTLRRADPVYPAQALQQLVSGWVELEFTITVDGAVKEVTVTASEPGRTFDSTAIAAMQRYRYEPIRRDGVAIEQRARLRMRFTAVNQ